MTVDIAIVGLGYWGPNLARVIGQAKGGRLHTLCDARPERLESLGRQYPHARAVSDFDAVLDDPEVTAVVIATPAATHHTLAQKALDAGKHVLVEKPLAMTVPECEDLIAAARRSGRTLMVGHTFIYNAAVRRVREYIASGELGDVLYVYSQRLNLGQVRSDTNALWNFGPHDLSILRYWLGGDPLSVVARGFDVLQPGIDDVVFMTLDYPDGIGANVHISWLDPAKVRRMTVVGSEKMVVYDDVSTEARIMLFDKGVTKAPKSGDPLDASLGRFETFAEFQLLLRAGDVLIPKVNFVEPLLVELEHFVQCIDSGETPETDGASGLSVVRALEMAQSALDRSRASTSQA